MDQSLDSGDNIGQGSAGYAGSSKLAVVAGFVEMGKYFNLTATRLDAVGFTVFFGNGEVSLTLSK